MRLSNFSSTKFIVVGAFLIFGGCLSIALGIPSATPINGSYPYGNLGYGIWGGLIYITAGLINIVVGCKTTPKLVVIAIVLNAICCVIGVLQLALGISAANQDLNAMRLRQMNAANESKAADYNAFYKQFFPMTYTIAHSQRLVDLHNGVVAVDALLAAAGFLVAILAAVSCSSAAVSVCCPDALIDHDAVVVVEDKKKKKKVVV